MKGKSCFIENDTEIDDDFKSYLLNTISHFTNNKDLEFDKLFDFIITEAYMKKIEVWNAINECKYIFISTGFHGESAYLLDEMCELALANKIKDKVIINFRDADSPSNPTKKGIEMLKELQEKNNVKYVSKDTKAFEKICKKLFL